MEVTFKKGLRTLMFLFLILLTFALSGCGDDAKSLVRNGIEDKSGVKISEVYNKKKDDEKSKFAKEVTLAYFEQAKVDMSDKFKPDFRHYKLDDSVGDLLSHIDQDDSNFMNLRKLHQLFQQRRSDGDKIVALHDKLGLGINSGDLRYDNAGPIDEYTVYIFHKVPFSDLQPVYAAIGYQVIGDEFIGRHVMPDFNNYLAMVHVPKNGSFFTQGQGVYTFYAARSGDVKFKDPAGFERNLPLLQLVPDGQVGEVRRFIYLHKRRVEMENVLIPQFINNVLAEPGGEFQTGAPSIDNPKKGVGSSDNKLTSINPADTPDAAAINKAIARVSSPSALNDSGQVYSADRIFDKDNRTCWADGVSGLGIGESVTVEFNGDYKVSGFRIWAGYHKSKDLFYKNSRPTAIRVIGSDGSNEVYSLEDSFNEQDIRFKQPVNVKSLKLVVEKVAKGTKYEDTCISEISFF